MGDGSDGRSYGTQDVVFYIMRCDADSPSDLPSRPVRSFHGSFSSHRTGWLHRSTMLTTAVCSPVQTKLRLVAAVSEIGDMPGGPMAPMSGFDIEESEPLGKWTQNAAFDVDVTTAVRNALRTVPGLGREVVVKGLASSEVMFNRMLLNGFVPLNDLNQIRTEKQILDTFDRPTTTDLAFLLARETDGITKMEDVVKAVNNGEIGAVTSKSRAYQERISPYTRRRR